MSEVELDLEMGVLKNDLFTTSACSTIYRGNTMCFQLLLLSKDTVQQINDGSCYKSVSTNKSDNDDDEMLVCVENYFAYKALST